MALFLTGCEADVEKAVGAVRDAAAQFETKHAQAEDSKRVCGRWLTLTVAVTIICCSLPACGVNGMHDCPVHSLIQKQARVHVSACLKSLKVPARGVAGGSRM